MVFLSTLSTRAQAGAPEAVGTGRPPHLSLVHPLGSKSPINRLLGSRGIELGDLCPAGTAPSASSLALWGQGLAGWGLQTALWLPWRQVQAGLFCSLPHTPSLLLAFLASQHPCWASTPTPLHTFRAFCVCVWRRGGQVLGAMWPWHEAQCQDMLRVKCWRKAWLQGLGWDLYAVLVGDRKASTMSMF